MKERIEAIKERYIHAKTDDEHEVVRKELRMLCDENAVEVADATLKSIKETNTALLRDKLNGILPVISVTKRIFIKNKAISAIECV